MSFRFNGVLGTGKDATSNPDPNGLTEDTPLTDLTMPYWRGNVKAAWITQSATFCKALFPYDGHHDSRLRLHFVPSGGAAVTYTVTMWVYNPVTDTWAQPQDNASVSFTGEKVHYIDVPGENPIFLQLSSISAGTLSIYFDNTVAEAY